MNKYLWTASLVLAGVMAAGGAMAQQTATLKVIGTIEPPACTPTFTAGETINYGTIPSTSFGATAHSLPEHPAELTVDCAADTVVAIGFTDERLPSKPTLAEMGTITKADGALITPPTNNQNVQTFSLGDGGTGQKVGLWWFGSSPTTLPTHNGIDGKLLYAATSSPADWVNWTGSPGVASQPFVSTHYYTISSAGSNVTPVAAKAHVFKFQVAAALNLRKNVTITDNMSLDGLATFTVAYP